MDKVLEYLGYLEGKKTYLLVLAGVLVVAGTALGWWTTEDVTYLWEVLALLGVGAGRSALKKLEQ